MVSGEQINVLQATAWFPPYYVGGTEVYVEGLVEELIAHNVYCKVLTPRHPEAPQSYVHGPTEVETWPVDASPATGELKRGSAPQGFSAFSALLLRQKRTIYHQHSWTRGCGPHHLRAARAMGFRTVLTVHVPGNLCLRGTMLHNGAEVCDGLLDGARCGACWLHSRGMPKALARGLASLPLSISRYSLGIDRRIATVISSRALAERKARELVEMAINADRVVAVCQWLFDALVANGVPQEKLILSRQGVSNRFLDTVRVAEVRRPRGGPLRLLFLGRWDRVKGIDVVIRALQLMPDESNVSLTIHAVPAPSGDTTYESFVLALAKEDPRITVEPPVTRDRLAATFASHDVLVVPSQWLETGPLVVLEAHAAGLFVLGSRLGGIAELVVEGAAGALVPPGDVTAWATAISRLIACRPRYPSSLPRSRDMATVAQESTDLYRSLMIGK